MPTRRAEVGRSQRGPPAGTLLAHELLPQGFGGFGRDGNDWSAGFILHRHRKIDQAVSRTKTLLLIEPSCTASERAPERSGDMLECNLLDELCLLRGAPLLRAFFVPTERAECPLFGHFITPVIKGHLECRAAFCRRAPAVQTSFLVERNIDRKRDTSLHFFELSQDIVEHRETLPKLNRASRSAIFAPWSANACSHPQLTADRPTNESAPLASAFHFGHARRAWVWKRGMLSPFDSSHVPPDAHSVNAPRHQRSEETKRSSQKNRPLDLALIIIYIKNDPPRYALPDT